MPRLSSAQSPWHFTIGVTHTSCFSSSMCGLTVYELCLATATWLCKGPILPHSPNAFPLTTQFKISEGSPGTRPLLSELRFDIRENCVPFDIPFKSAQYRNSVSRIFWCTINTRYRLPRYRHSHVTGNRIACTNFPPPKRLRYRR